MEKSVRFPILPNTPETMPKPPLEERAISPKKLRKHIQDVLAEHDGKINYDSVADMHYLEQCINGISFKKI